MGEQEGGGQKDRVQKRVGCKKGVVEQVGFYPLMKFWPFFEPPDFSMLSPPYDILPFFFFSETLE